MTVRTIIERTTADLVRVVPQSKELDEANNKLDDVMLLCYQAIERHGVSSPEEGA